MPATIFGKEVPTTLEELVDPRSTALVVWDLQYCIIAGRAGEQILKPLSRLIDAARAVSVPVVYTQQTIWKPEKESPARLRWIAKRMRIPVEQLNADMPRFKTRLVGAKEWEIHEAVRPQPQDFVVRKFREPAAWLQFDSLFKSMGIKSVIITGISSCGGVFPTARFMFSMEYHPVVAADCISSNEEALHQAALTIIRDNFDLVDSGDIIRAWGRAA